MFNPQGPFTRNSADLATRMEARFDELAGVSPQEDPGTATLPTCEIEWGACPDHGKSLRSSGGETWCTVFRCGRRWNTDRLTCSCTETATHRATDETGTVLLCDGHVVAIRDELPAAIITRLQA